MPVLPSDGSASRSDDNWQSSKLCASLPCFFGALQNADRCTPDKFREPELRDPLGEIEEQEGSPNNQRELAKIRELAKSFSARQLSTTRSCFESETCLRIDLAGLGVCRTGPLPCLGLQVGRTGGHGVEPGLW